MTQSAVATHRADPTERTIEPSAWWRPIDLRELWAARGVLYFLAWRDVKVRYAQTLLGAGWAVLQPLLMMVVLTVIFGRLAALPSDGVPYSAFSLSGLVLWTFFATVVAGASESLVASRNLVTKVYFPRLVIPLAPVLAGTVDLVIACSLLLVFAAFLQLTPTPLAVFVVPLVIATTWIAAAGVGCWLAALNLRYRDVRYTVPFLLQLWMYASPIVYPTSLVPDQYRAAYLLNPMAGLVANFRAAMLAHRALDWGALGIAVGVALVLFTGGLVYFRQTERSFADIA
jgi:lipopolysaccharide transport system permease protein